MTPFSSIASLSFFCLLVLLLPPQHGASPHPSYKVQGSNKQVYLRTQATATSCSYFENGLGDQITPRDASRSSPRVAAPAASPAVTASAPSPAATAPAPSPAATSPAPAPAASAPSPAATVPAPAPTPTASAPSPAATAPAPAPTPTASAPSPSAATTIPVNISSDPRKVPGMLDYSVVVSYGTPPQEFPLFLHTSKIGASLLRCKPCSSGSDDCDPAFDTLASSTFAPVLCGSPDCPTNCSGDGDAVCPLDGPYSVLNATYAEDVLTLAPSMAIDDFKFVCMGADKPQGLPFAGTIDLSQDPNSVPSQLSASLGLAPEATFSYCLPHSPSSQGFLSFGGDASVISDDDVTVHAPLVNSSNPELASKYFVDLVGISLGDEDLPIPRATFSANGTNLDVGTTFTMLSPDAYTVLRDSFREQMSDYNFSSSGEDGFDTCFNFTGLDELVIPNVQFKFSNGESLMIHGDQMLYYDDPDAGPFTMACLAFASLKPGVHFSGSVVIGAYTLATTEVVYDVAGGKVGFKPWSC